MAFKSPFRNDLLDGKVALITGGATGINFEIARCFVQHGCSVVLFGRREKVLQDAVNTLKREGYNNVLAVQGDVRDNESAIRAIQETVKRFSKLDILVNGAAGNFLCAAENLSAKGFKTVVDIDLIGTFTMSRNAFEYLKETKGCIINISATLHYHTTPWQVHASAAKAGVDSVTQSLAREWGEFGIRVNAIAPGPIKDTEGASKLSLGIPPQDMEDLVAQAVPIGRIGTKYDIGLAALFLASDQTSSFVTGDILVVDGGATLWSPPHISRDALAALSSERKSKL